MSALVYVFAFMRPDERWGVANDPEGRLIVTRYSAVAERFAATLEERTGTMIVPVQRDPMQVAELVMSAHAWKCTGLLH